MKTIGRSFKNVSAACIYCNSTFFSVERPNKALSDEHIIPEGIGGRLILKKASCESCQILINITETNYITNYINPIRTKILKQNLQKQMKKSYFPVQYRSTMGTSNTLVHYHHIPTNIALIEFSGVPTILTAPQACSPPLNSKRISIFFDDLRWRSHAHALPTNDFLMSKVPSNILVSRFVAKIAFSYAKSSISDFIYHAQIPDIILNDSPKNIGNYVGGQKCNKIPNLLHSLTHNIDKDGNIVVYFQMFSFFVSYRFVVAVGKTSHKL